MSEHKQRRQATVLAPPKAVFQFLSDPSIVEEFTSWKVSGTDVLAEGAQWQERRLLRRRKWRVTAFDRRGLWWEAEGPVRLRIHVKKGGTGSSNVHMEICGLEGAVRRFLKSDGDRLDLFKAWLES